MRLVFLHGWGYSPGVWDAVRHELQEFHTEAIHLPLGVDDFNTWAQANAASLESGFMLIGWSLGAQMALAIAASRQPALRGLFLIGASPCFVAHEAWPHGLAPETVANFRKNFAQAPERTQKRFLALQTLGDSRRAMLSAALEAALASPHTTGLDAGLAQLESADLRSLTYPQELACALLHGRNDALMPLAAAKYLQQTLPNAALEIVEEAGHAPLFSQPEQLAQRIRSFAHGAF